MAGAPRVALDTSVLTHLVRPDRPTVGQESQWRDAWELDSSEIRLVVPAPVYAEVVSGVSPAHLPAALSALGAFDVVAFDARAAELVARIAQAAGPRPTSGAASHREQIKVDWMIVGCAVRWGAELCTTDGQQVTWFRSIAPAAHRAGDPNEFLRGTVRNLDI